MLQPVGSDASTRVSRRSPEQSSTAGLATVRAWPSMFDTGDALSFAAALLAYRRQPDIILVGATLDTVGSSPALVLQDAVLPTAAVPALSGIKRTPGVCGGAARIAGTRIPVWTIERFRQLGASKQDLLAFFPTLSEGQLERALEYASAHPDEVLAQVLQNESPNL